MKVEVEQLQVGQTIGMMGGAVRVTVAPKEATDIWDEPMVQVGVSIGKLVDHPMKFTPGTEFDVLNMPADLAPWFGV